ncbi:MAG: hypothetical protein EAX96_08660 [Candidatus Lokiarchaeota archaeon]|nr:hypothetical protein [Candidatus Lokiarchaeota archaeon]
MSFPVKEAWVTGYWKNLLDNPPCKKPSEPRNKDFEYNFQVKKNSITKLNEVYLDLIGEELDLNQIEKELSKFKLCRIVDENQKLLTLIVQAGDQSIGTISHFHLYCKDLNFKIISKEVHPLK